MLDAGVRFDAALFQTIHDVLDDGRAARLWESVLVVGFASSANGAALEANQTFQRAAQVEAMAATS